MQIVCVTFLRHQRAGSDRLTHSELLCHTMSNVVNRPSYYVLFYCRTTHVGQLLSSVITFIAYFPRKLCACLSVYRGYTEPLRLLDHVRARFNLSSSLLCSPPLTFKKCLKTYLFSFFLEHGFCAKRPCSSRGRLRRYNLKFVRLR